MQIKGRRIGGEIATFFPVASRLEAVPVRTVPPGGAVHATNAAWMG
jgi:hypothetical protein